MLTIQEWTALSKDVQEDYKKDRKDELPAEIRQQVEADDRQREKNALAEKERKLTASQKEVQALKDENARLATQNAPAKTTEEYIKQYETKLAESPFAANAGLIADGVRVALGNDREASKVRRVAVRKLQKKFGKEYNKYEEALEDMLDGIKDPSTITEKSITIMFDSLRGKSVEQLVKEGEARGAQRALEDAGIVAIGEALEAGPKGEGKSTLTPEQKAECDEMGLEEQEYKDILRGLQEKDKAASRTPRTLVNK